MTEKFPGAFTNGTYILKQILLHCSFPFKVRQDKGGRTLALLTAVIKFCNGAPEVLRDHGGQEHAAPPQDAVLAFEVQVAEQKKLLKQFVLHIMDDDHPTNFLFFTCVAWSLVQKPYSSHAST